MELRRSRLVVQTVPAQSRPSGVTTELRSRICNASPTLRPPACNPDPSAINGSACPTTLSFQRQTDPRKSQRLTPAQLKYLESLVSQAFTKAKGLWSRAVIRWNFLW
jgi:hypothetical protein